MTDLPVPADLNGDIDEKLTEGDRDGAKGSSGAVPFTLSSGETTHDCC